MVLKLKLKLKFEIPYDNLIDLAADNANVMLGQHKSVHTLLPEYLEKFIHNIYNYFSKSSKGIEPLSKKIFF